MDNFYERHVLHSLAIAKVLSFEKGDVILDIGTGGVRGIPLAILFPESRFILADSITKKISVAGAVINALGLKNVEARAIRAEMIKEPADYVVTRAVAKVNDWSKNKHPKKIIALKGGDLKEELQGIQKNIRIVDIPDFFTEPFFETKRWWL